MKTRRKWLRLYRRLHEDERGATLVLFTIMLLVFMGVAAMVIDGGVLLVERRQLQNAADAAALAGAQELPRSPGDAVAAAVAYASLNKTSIAPSDVVIDAYDPDTKSCAPNGTTGAMDNACITVSPSKTINLFFAKAFGLRTGMVAATATAIAGLDENGAIPFAVNRPYDWGAQVELELDFLRAGSGDGNTIPARIDKPGIGNCNQAADDPTGNQYCPGIKFGTHRYLCAQDRPGCTDPSDYIIQSQPGQGLGEFFPKTMQAVQWRINRTGTDCNQWTEVQTNLQLNPGCNPFGRYANPDSKRVVVLIMVRRICANPEPPCDMTIREFAMFFIDHIDDGSTCNPRKCLLEVDGYFVARGSTIRQLMSNAGASEGTAPRLIK